MKQFTAVRKKQTSLSNWLTFLIPSLIGLLLFVTPVSLGGEYTIPVALLAGGLKTLLKEQLTAIITIIVTFTGLITIITKVFQPQSIMKRPFLNSLFDITPLWCLVRVTGMVFVIFSYFAVSYTHLTLPTICSV